MKKFKVVCFFEDFHFDTEVYADDSHEAIEKTMLKYPHCGSYSINNSIFWITHSGKIKEMDKILTNDSKLEKGYDGTIKSFDFTTKTHTI